MSLTLPEYGNREQVVEAVRKQEAVIKAADALTDVERAKLAAIRKMCSHDYSKRYSCGRDAGDKCDICGGWR